MDRLHDLPDAPPDAPPAVASGTGPADLVVRPAHEHELDAAGAVVALAYATDGYAVGDYLDVLADARDRARDATVAVAVTGDGEVVGSVTFTLPGTRWAELSSPGEAEFRALGVAPAARGRGVGRALAQWCLDEAHRLGAHRLVLCSLDTMHGAHRLYAELGFRRRPDLDWEPEPGVVLLGFDRDLGRPAPTSADRPAVPAADVDTPPSADATPTTAR